MTDDHKTAEQGRKKPMSFPMIVALTGLVGGILWGGIGYLAYVFNFSEIRPNIILEPWALGGWKEKGLGTAFSIVMIGFISIIAAFIYYFVLRKFKSIMVGIFFGIGLFLLVFFVLNPLFPGMPPLNELKRNTIVTSICLYILFGAFIGYSISYEEQQQVWNQKEQETQS